MDAGDLRAAYERFLQTAASASECDATDAAGWSVAMVVAHVAANDRLISAHLGRAIPTDVDARIDDARASSGELIALVEQLDEETSALVFRTTIMDGDIVQLDGPVPLAGLLGAQVRVHLPLHTAQIEELAGA